MTVESVVPDAMAIWRSPDFRRGAKGMLPASLGIMAWGLVAGVAMTKSGLSVPLALMMTLMVFAGTSQLAVLPLMVAQAPIWLVCATAFCVNLRFMVYSLQWRPYLAHLPRLKRCALAYFTADLNYIMFTRRFPEPRPSPEQVPFFLGGVFTSWLSWQVPSIIGIVLADHVPTSWGLGFIGTLALLALSYTMMTDRSMWITAAVAGCAAVAAYALPLNLNIVVAIAAAVAIGLMLDHREAVAASKSPAIASKPVDHR